jgi:flagellar basal body-associated protein FliL
MPANDDPNNIAAPSNRGLKAIVIILGILIVLAFAALVVGFFSRLSGGGGSGSSDSATQMLLPAGSKILQVQVTTNSRIVMAVQTPSGAEVDIFDTDTGRLVGRIKPAPVH